jgi:serine protease inhibitor ecotin
MAYDRFVVDKSTEEVSFTLNYPKMSDLERVEALKVEEPPKKKRKRNPNRMTGLIGVNKSGMRYQASISYGGKQHHLGRFDTKEQAGIAYDRVAIDKSTEEFSFTLNYPNMSDPEREEALKVEPPKKRRRGNPNQTTGLIGVRKTYGNKYKTSIKYGGTSHYLGHFDTKEQAGMAYDRFVVDKSTEEVSYTLNYPNMNDHEREEALKVESPTKRRRGNPNQKTGLIGVCKVGEKYKAYIDYGGKTKSLGNFDTKEQAGIAYDRFVVDKSTEEVSFTLNYPKMSDLERVEALKVEEPPKKKRKRAKKQRK